VSFPPLAQISVFTVAALSRTECDSGPPFATPLDLLILKRPEEDRGFILVIGAGPLSGLVLERPWDGPSASLWGSPVGPFSPLSILYCACHAVKGNSHPFSSTPD